MLEEFNLVLDYIEDNLTGEIDMKKISQLSKLSTYNFQKIFSVLTDVSFGDYVRRRRLSRSLFDLCETDESIIYIAGKYGYESSDSFSRSFKQYFGETPSYIRQTKRKLKTFPKFLVSVKIEGGIEMDYQIINKKAFNVMGISANFNNEEEGHAKIGGLWSRFNQSDDDEKLRLLCTKDSDFQGTVGVCLSSGVDESYDYVIGVITDEENSDEYGVFNIPEKKYLVFDVQIEDENVSLSIQQTYKTIFSTVLPGTGYTFKGADFEFYPDDVEGESWIPQIWIPVE